MGKEKRRQGGERKGAATQQRRRVPWNNNKKKSGNVLGKYCKIKVVLDSLSLSNSKGTLESLRTGLQTQHDEGKGTMALEADHNLNHLLVV